VGRKRETSNLPFSLIFCILIPATRSRADYKVNKVVNAQSRELKLQSLEINANKPAVIKYYTYERFIT